VKEDDEVDNMEIKLDSARKSKRVYKSPSPEVIQKIRQSLKVSSFNYFLLNKVPFHHGNAIKIEKL
jgi:hypothetical protein